MIYVDYQSTTPVDKRVLDAMVPYFHDLFGNSSSNTHKMGYDAKKAVDKARAVIAASLNADPSEIIFTSGATESNNLILKGIYEFNEGSGKTHIITTKVEHKCILSTVKYLESRGATVTYVPVDGAGMVDPKDIENAIQDNTCVVSIIAASNEVGTVQDIDKIGSICRSKGVIFHTDAAQLYTKRAIDVKKSCIDAMSISGHKIYGPKGIGVLYIGKKPRVRILPQMHGGGQERGLRSGTLPVALIVGLSKAVEVAMESMEEESSRITKMRDTMLTKLSSALEKIDLNGHPTHRIPGNLNVRFAGVEGEGLMLNFFNHACMSSGSACTSESLEGSYVLKAMGIPEDVAHSSLRIGIGRFTTQEELDEITDRIIVSVNKMRELSPLWDMIQEGVDLSAIEWDEH